MAAARRRLLAALDEVLDALDDGTVGAGAVGAGAVGAGALRAIAPHPRRCQCGWQRLANSLVPLDAMRWVWLDDQGHLCATCPPSSRIRDLERFFSRAWRKVRVEYCGTDLVIDAVGARPRDSRRFTAVAVSPDVYAVVTGLRPSVVLLTATSWVRALQRRALGLSDGEARLVRALAGEEPGPSHYMVMQRDLEAFVAHQAAHPGAHPLGDQVLEVMIGLASGWSQGLDDLISVSCQIAAGSSVPLAA